MTDTPKLPLDCGLAYDDFSRLRNTTPLSRVNVDEAKAIFDKLYALGFKVVPRQD